MIVDYFRPETIKEAIELLNREKPRTIPLGGGISISQRKGEDLGVVDLQRLNLNQITEKDNKIVIGSTITIQELINSSIFTDEIKELFTYESTTNLRQVATLAGTLLSSDGHSYIAAVFSALSAILVWEPGNLKIPFSELERTKEKPFAGKLITKILIPREFLLKWEVLSNSPDSKPNIIVVHMTNKREDVFAFGGDTDKPIHIEKSAVHKFIQTAHSHYTTNILSNNYLLSTLKTFIDRL